MLQFDIGNRSINLAESVIRIIDEYVATREDAFKRFIDDCERLRLIEAKEPDKAQALAKTQF